MSNIEELALWLAVMFPLVFSPGPGNLLCAVCGASNGLKKSMPFILGLETIYTLYSLAIGFGMLVVIQQFPHFFNSLQLFGAIYVAWLGYQFLERKKSDKNISTPKLRFIDGAISQALNIKGVSIIFTMYSQFLDSNESLLYETVSLSLCLFSLNLFTHITWAYSGAWLSKKLTSTRAINLQNYIYGLLLFLISFWLIYSAILNF